MRNHRYKDRESWRKITAAYATSRSTNSRRRFNTTNFSSASKKLDTKGKFMRDIVNATEAVELAFAKSNKEAEHVSATTLPISNSRLSHANQIKSGNQEPSGVNERRVKTADRTARSTKAANAKSINLAGAMSRSKNLQQQQSPMVISGQGSA